MNSIRNRISPGLRGAIFYAAYWGVDGLYEPFLNVYYLGLGLDGTQIGWLAAVLPLCVMAIAPLVARLADLLGRRVWVLAVTMAFYAVALTLPAWPVFRPSFLALMGFVALFAVFRSPIVSLADSLIAGMAVRHALDFGSMRLWGSIFFTITACTLGLLWTRTGYETMYLVTGLGFLPVVFVALMLEETPAHKPAGEAASEGKDRPDGESSPAGDADTLMATRKRPSNLPPLDSGLLFLLGATFLTIAALFMGGTFGGVYMAQIGGSAAMVGILNGLSALGEVPGMLFGSRIARRLGDTNALLASYLITACGMATYGLAHTPQVLLIGALLRGLGFGQMLVSTIMIINSRAPREYAATYQGILNSACWGLAPLLGGPSSGWIYQHLGPSALFFTAAVMTMLSAVLIAPTYRIWKADVRLVKAN